MCVFKNESNICFLTKKDCTEKFNNNCKYYLRQKPKDKKVYIERFKKVLKKALETRDILKNYNYLLDENQLIDFNKTIYENVRAILDNVQNYTIIKKELRKLSDEDLEGNILQNITNNMYTQIPIEIVKKFDKKNTIIIKENDNTYCCELEAKVPEFIEKLKKAKKKDIYLNKMIRNKIKIK